MGADDIPLHSLGIEGFVSRLRRMDGLAAPLETVDRFAWRSEACQNGTPREHARCAHPSNRRRYDGCTCSCHRREGAR